MNIKFTWLLLVLMMGMLNKGYAQPSSCDNDPLARPMITATNNGVVCNGNPITLTVTSQPGGPLPSWFNIQWFVNGSLMSATTRSITVNSSGGTYVVRASNSECMSTTRYESAPFTVTGSPVNSVSISGYLSVIPGGTTSLSASPTGPGITYSWSNGATTQSTIVGAGTYTVTASDGSGCSGSATVTVVENPGCIPNVSVTNGGVICNGAPVTLSVTNASNFSAFQWYISAPDTQPVGTAPDYITSQPGTYFAGVVHPACGPVNSSGTVVTTSNITASISGNLMVPVGGTTTLTASPAGSGISYAWSNGSSAQSITVGAGTYTVTVTNLQGCSDAETVTVTEIVGCTPVISTTGGNICNGNPVTLSVNNPSTYTSFQWFQNGNSLSGATNSTYAATAAGSYHVAVTSGCGAASSSPLSITSSNITAGITGNLTISPGGTTTLTATPAALSYSWSTGSTAPSITIGAGTYTVTVTDGQGCSDAATVTVIESATCTPTVNSTSGVICNGNAVTLSVSNASSFTSFQWNLDGNPISGATSSSFAASSGGSYTVVASSASCGSGTSSPVLLTVSTITATINGNLIVPTGGTTTLTATPGGMTYLWSTGVTSQSVNVGSGTYTVTVTNAQGCSDAETVVVTESSTCSPVINSPGTAICNGTSMTLTVANAASFSSFQWLLNGSTISGATSSSYSATQAGTYTVTANSATCGSITSAAATLTASSVTASVTGNLNVPVGGTTTLTAMPAGLTYNWSTGSIAQSVSVGAGTYTVTVTNAEGCNDIETVTVTENAACSPALSTTAGVICNNNQVTITVVNASNFTSFQWYKDGTAITGASGSSYSTNTPGSYSVQANSASCGTINSSPLIIGTSNITATITGNLSILPGGTTTLTASPAGMTYLWSTGATSQTITAGAGTYTVTVTNSQGCSDNETVTVVENSGCSPTVSASGNVICNGNAITLTVTNASSFTSFQWYLDGNSISGATGSTYSASAAGSYYVTVTAASCGSGNSTPISITASNISASISGNTSIPVGGTTTLTAIPAGMTYLWNNGTSTQSISVGAGSYSVTVTNAEGCFATASVTVTESGSCTITVAATNGGVICNGNPVNLSFSPAGLNSFQWQLNGNNITGATASTYAASTAGSYTVSANSATCGNATSSPVNVTSSVVVASISVTANGGGSITLTASPAGMNYLWVPGGLTTQSITETPTASKTYTVTVTNAQGCTSSANYTYNYNGGTGPHIITASSSTSFCEGGSVVLMGPTGYTSYLWDPGNATTQSISIAPSVGTYVYGLTAINTNTNTIEYDTIHITVNQKPTIGINAVDNGNGTWTLTATPPGLSYQWSTGAPTQSITVSAIGTYTVTGTTTTGCSAQASHQVTCIISAPVVTAQGPTSWCGSGSVQLTASSATVSVTGWQWYKNGVLIAGATGNNYSATTAGTYTVEIITACGNKMSNGLTVTTGNYPTGDFTITGSPANYGGMISYTATVNGANDYTWYFGDGQFALNAGSTADHYYYQAGTMTVRLVAADAGGCELIIEKTVVVADNSIIDTTGSSGNYKLNIFPNPYRDKLYITFMLTSDSKVVLDIANPSGRIIRRVEFNGRAGSNKFLIPYAGLLNSNVTYLFRVSINGKKYSDKILKY